MRKVRFVLSRFLMIWLVATVVTGSIGMSAAGAVPVAGAGQADDVGAMTPGVDCDMASDMKSNAKGGHADCAMTICCYPGSPDLAALEPDFEIMTASYVLTIEPRLTQAEPERAKKPPRTT